MWAGWWSGVQSWPMHQDPVKAGRGSSSNISMCQQQQTCHLSGRSDSARVTHASWPPNLQSAPAPATCCSFISPTAQLSIPFKDCGTPHLELVDEQVLQDGHLGGLATHADLGAAGVALGLLAL